ncbi:Protein phosphatase 2C 7 [Tieghemiomyces parasiticus]|uniref:Protein phosphatase n=1 Tax=Tieghemiomyces parasiticus TaxID=78921 RepID=A0A9W8AGE8_9FUNG|nr:Protein phosphatase 2C 7 [Tieghemiomyces parasiticus]
MRAIIASAWHSKARLYEVLKPGSKAPREIRPTTNSSGSTGYQSLASTNAGEDALFHVRHEASGRIIFGVDPSLFSRRILRNIYERVTATGLTEREQCDPMSLLKHAYSRLVEEGEPEYGSSTVTFASIDPATGTLDTLQLGDSGLMIFSARDAQITQEPDEQVHGFNHPFQLTALPRAELQRHGLELDQPEHARIARYQLRPNDLVLIATDGLFDNVPAAVLQHVVQDCLSVAAATEQGSVAPSKAGNGGGGGTSETTDANPGTAEMVITRHQADRVEMNSLVKAAGDITTLATLYSLDPKAKTPFSQRAKQAGRNFKGGKIDDVTAILFWWQPSMYANAVPNAKL